MATAISAVVSFSTASMSVVSDAVVGASSSPRKVVDRAGGLGKIRGRDGGAERLSSRSQARSGFLHSFLDNGHLFAALLERARSSRPAPTSFSISSDVYAAWSIQKRCIPGGAGSRGTKSRLRPSETI